MSDRRLEVIIVLISACIIIFPILYSIVEKGHSKRAFGMAYDEVLDSCLKYKVHSTRYGEFQIIDAECEKTVKNKWRSE